MKFFQIFFFQIFFKKIKQIDYFRVRKFLAQNTGSLFITCHSRILGSESLTGKSHRLKFFTHSVGGGNDYFPGRSGDWLLGVAGGGGRWCAAMCHDVRPRFHVGVLRKNGNRARMHTPKKAPAAMRTIRRQYVTTETVRSTCSPAVLGISSRMAGVSVSR